ncbi:MAG: heme exporter protein CcmB [Gammaproteobacteria bacterium]|nr:heme exporter protein CcmB [Gammaproteobacteria bacterium]
MLDAFTSLMRRDLSAALHIQSNWLMPVAFFTIIISLFPLGADADPALLQRFAPGVIWVAALLAGLLSLERAFKDDFENGSLEQWLITPHGVYPFALARILAHWCTTGLPFTLLAPFYGYLLGLPVESLPVAVFSLALGTPVLSALGAVGAALTGCLRGGEMLMVLLVLPFYVPLLVFGANAMDMAAAGLPAGAALAILGALFIVALLLAPLAVAAALKVMLD